VFDIDSFKSKVGDDEDVITMSFTVDHEDPAKDLENFIEMGYDFVLDADVSPGELDDGTYKVYVEIERGRHAAEQIKEIIEGIEKLTGIEDFRFIHFNLQAVRKMITDTVRVQTKAETKKEKI